MRETRCVPCGAQPCFSTETRLKPQQRHLISIGTTTDALRPEEERRMPATSLRQGQITRLLMQYRTALYGYIYASVRNHPDAEDIFQNVSVAVTESLGQLRDEAGFLPL